ncbi:insulinase family protein [candidate division WOR-3 bacterium]|uniref:Insulinase family protein n=1 Tax=candidate division WOR-3 bacterium TaxID=2052148 RepID=A0A9D5QD03_UNCW3|nr:insulinase family protein [candidate division WOR-3 bacterium]MBD3365114.1 insulinase family protein [candidate division WOR-3 bacterium]
MKQLARFLFFTLLLPLITGASTYAELEERVVEHELENGMRFLIFERHDAPLVSMVISVKAGAANEVTNKTGVAHFLEHLAFKGTKNLGTTDYDAEKDALAELDKTFEAWFQASQAGAESAVLDRLYADFIEKQDEAFSYIVEGEIGKLYEGNGGTSVNAATSYDYTTYQVTLPSNRFKLWCAVESDRMANPVFRELYRERNVILEERRKGTDNSPTGLFWEEFNCAAYKAHPYGRPIIGHYSDMENLSRETVRDFYETFYVPQHMTAGIAGDVNAEEIIPLLDAYFGRIQTKPDPPEIITTEPEQPGIRRVEVKLAKTPITVVKFLTVPRAHPDEIPLDLLATILGGGQTSRLHRALVEKRKLATYVSAYHPTRRHGGYFQVYARPVEGVTPGELEVAVLEELRKIKDNPVNTSELEAARARIQIGIFDAFSNNLRLARNLALADQQPDGWRNTFRRLEQASLITPDDLTDVAGRYLDFDKRTVGLMEVTDD